MVIVEARSGPLSASADVDERAAVVRPCRGVHVRERSHLADGETGRAERGFEVVEPVERRRELLKDRDHLGAVRVACLSAREPFVGDRDRAAPWPTHHAGKLDTGSPGMWTTVPSPSLSTGALKLPKMWSRSPVPPASSTAVHSVACNITSAMATSMCWPSPVAARWTSAARMPTVAWRPEYRSACETASARGSVREPAGGELHEAELGVHDRCVGPPSLPSDRPGRSR